MFSSLLGGSRRSVLLRAGLLIPAIALIDWRTVNEVPLGVLYLLPMLMVGRVLTPWQIAGAATLCTVLTEFFDAFVWNLRTGMPRDVLYFVAFFSVGLFVYEVNRNRQIVIEHLHEIERQRGARRDADSDGRVLMANEAAHRMLALESAALPGRSIHRYFPSLSNVSRRDANQQLFRTVMQSRGQREDGEVFLADICFSTYRTDA